MRAEPSTRTTPDPHRLADVSDDTRICAITPSRRVPVAALPSAGPSSCTPARSGPGRGRSYNERTFPPSVGGALLFRINAPDRTCVDRRTRPRHDTEPDASVTQRDDAWAPILFFVLHDKDNSTARGLPVSVRWLGLSWCATRI
jgi:hypothetical protein